MSWAEGASLSGVFLAEICWKCSLLHVGDGACGHCLLLEMFSQCG